MIIVSTNAGHLANAESLAARYGTAALLQKPFNLDDLLVLVAAALKR